MKRIMFLFLGMMLCIVSGFSQDIRSYVITSAGDALYGSEAVMYVSIGEPMSTEISGGEIMISQGFLQVSISESTDNENILQEEINVYPNPTSSDLILELPEMKGAYRYQLMNSMGANIGNSEIVNARTLVDLNLLSSGTYFLKVIKGSESSRTLKIVKL